MTYVRNAWYVAAWAHEIVAERLVAVRILNEPIVLWRNAKAELAAFEDRCLHRLAPLSLGRCEGDQLRCMYHGLLYDRGGHVTEIPGQDRIPSSLCVRTFPVVERHSWIWVWMGDAAAADERLIPSVVGIDMGGTDHVFGHGQLDYAAEARLVTENLLDFSHLSFLHAESLAASETWARERPKITEHARGIRTERWIRNQGPHGYGSTGTLVDSYVYYDCFVPGVVLVVAATYPVGTADLLHAQQPGLDQAVFVSHAVTPMTEKTTRYFYMAAMRRYGDETEADMTSLEKAFTEDKVMIEAQQRILDVTPDCRMALTTADTGIVLFNRLVEKLELHEAR
jgi:phenylpropionate dioxygenase-like ring-hydroxylating dioxygenase large terminal subunit